MPFEHKGSSESDSGSGSLPCASDLCPAGCTCFSEEFCAALDGNVIPQYIINPDTFVVCYGNQALRDVLKKDIRGQLCYKEMRNQDSPCVDCPAIYYYRNNDSVPKLVMSPFGYWLMIHASPVYWRGNTLIMLTCVKVDPQEKEQVYKNWNNRLEALMKKYTAYMEVNLSQNHIVSEGHNGAWHQELGGRKFSEFVTRMSTIGIWQEDQQVFETFFDRDRLMGQFMDGQTETGEEYRALVDGKPLWFRAEVVMMQDADTGDIMASVLYSNVDSNKREKERLTREAERDTMTGLYNHATAENIINAILDQQTGESCCLLVIDLDDLRIINSDLGHPEGDRALKNIAEMLEKQFNPDSIFGRIGGDEFVVLLRNVADFSELHKNVERFIEQLRKCRIGKHNDRAVHVSIGGAVGVTGEHDFKTLYRQADLALFYTKAHGKNGFHLYDPDMEHHQFNYKPRSAVSLLCTEQFESSEMQKLLYAVASFFPMIVSSNLTRNSYYMMEYKEYIAQHSKDEGVFDDLIREGCETFHPEDQKEFMACFARENLLHAYAEGRRMVQHVGRQMCDDGRYRLVQIVAQLFQDEETGDICDISFTHVLPAAPGGEEDDWVRRVPALNVAKRK